MDCCKKEEDCCPCESMAPRIECLQAQIGQLTAENRVRELEISLLIGKLFKDAEDFGPPEDGGAIILNRAWNRVRETSTE